MKVSNKWFSELVNAVNEVSSILNKIEVSSTPTSLNSKWVDYSIESPPSDLELVTVFAELGGVATIKSGRYLNHFDSGFYDDNGYKIENVKYWLKEK